MIAILKLRIRLCNLASVFKIFYHECRQLFHWRPLVPILYGILGIFLQVAALGIIFYYAGHLVADKPVFFLNVLYPPRSSLLLLSAVAFLCFILLMVSGLCTYHYHSQSIVMSCAFEKHCMKNFFTQINQLQSLGGPEMNKAYGQNTLIKIAMNDTRACGRAFMLAMAAIVPLLTFLTSTVMLLFTNWLVTSFLFPALLAFLLSVYKVNLIGVRNSRDVEKYGARVRDEFRTHLLLCQEQPENTNADSPFSTASQDANVHQYLRAYGGLIGLSYRSALVNDLFLALLLTGVFFSLSAAAIISQGQWGGIVVYLIALRYVISSLKQTTNKFTLMNRFYPQVSRFFKFRDIL